MATESRPTKIRKTRPYKLFYAFLAVASLFVSRLYSSRPYVEANDPRTLLSTLTDAKHTGGAPPAFAPPALELPSGRILSQTPAILNFLAPKLGLAGAEDGMDEDDKEEVRACVNLVMLTALDINNEVHDTHHPTAISQFYEEQKEAAAVRTKDFRARLPKYLATFEKTLTANPANSSLPQADSIVRTSLMKANSGDISGGPYLVSKQATTADLTVFHVIQGLLFAFPRRMKTLRATDEYSKVFKLHKRVKAEERIEAYFASERRLPFSRGIFRHYPELDGEE